MRSRISTSIFFISVIVIVIIISHPSGASAQKVLQCAPGMATVNNNLTVSGDLTVNNKAAVNNDLIVNKDIFAASGSQKIYLGPDAASPYISNNINGGEGILFYSNGGQNFLWQSPSGVNPDAMILKAGGGLPNNNNYNLQVFGQVSSYQMHAQGIHLDSQGIGSGLNSNIIKLTNTAGAGNGAGIFIGDGSDNLILSALLADGSPGTTMLSMDTSSNNIGIQTINPQITLAIGDNDTGLKWISDGNFQLVSNGTQELTIDPGNVRVRNNLCFGNDCKSAWPAAVAETDPTVLASVKDGVSWGELSSIPADIADGDQVGITSVPNCGAVQKLTGAGGLPVCANDIDTDTDAQTLTIAANVISLTNGGSVTLPASGVTQIVDGDGSEGISVSPAIGTGAVSLSITTPWCDWIGWTDTVPWSGGKLCQSNILIKDIMYGASKDIWLEAGSCSTSHAKGYTCTLTITANGSYSLICDTTNENHNEWYGSLSDQRNPSNNCGSAACTSVAYDSNTGKWTLTSIGKENNVNNPRWTTRICSAGGYK